MTVMSLKQSDRENNNLQLPVMVSYSLLVGTTSVIIISIIDHLWLRKFDERGVK